MNTVIRGKISSELDDLDHLNQSNKWIPNRTQIRPTQEQIAKKALHLDYVRQSFHSEVDFVYKSTFGFASKRVDGLHLVADKANLEKKKVFAPNLFPYQTEGKHFIMWYTYQPPEEEINKDIEEEIGKILGHANFQYGWYDNPKKTIPEIFHVQVFWTENSKILQV